MNLNWNGLGVDLLDAATQSSDEVILVAPFIKFKVLERILNEISDEVAVHCYTRWRCDEIAQGVSDIEIWNIFQSRKKAKLFLIQNLHSKYYRFDTTLFIGSANLTNAGLTWSFYPNLETLLRVDVSSVNFINFESYLVSSSVAVDQKLFDRTKAIVDAFKAKCPNAFMPNVDILLGPAAAEIEGQSELIKNEEVMVYQGFWIPTTRSPEQLYSVYSSNFDGVSKDFLLGALKDLSYLDLPPNMDITAFNEYVKNRLLLEPLLSKLDEFLYKPRRFGEMRDFLERLSVEDSTHNWQTLMRWLLHYIDDRYEARVANFSEIFKRKN